ncbi:hypothetical protein AAG570_007037 [Ranatra chinensis]|uniref:Uncharacterized protein n=1 Tax=Ranatra chinensis TaxID=642074 RepID=A0ABD0YVT1_9HEMI
MTQKIKLKRKHLMDTIDAIPTSNKFEALSSAPEEIEVLSKECVRPIVFNKTINDVKTFLTSCQRVAKTRVTIKNTGQTTQVFTVSGENHKARRELVRQLNEIIDIIADNRVDKALIAESHLQSGRTNLISIYTIYRKDHLADWKQFRDSLNDSTTAKPALITDKDIDDKKLTSDFVSLPYEFGYNQTASLNNEREITLNNTILYDEQGKSEFLLQYFARIHIDATEQKGFEEEKVNPRLKRTIEAVGKGGMTSAVPRRRANKI